MTSQTKHHPHVTRAETLAALQTRPHPLDPEARYTSAPLSNILGMSQCEIGLRYAKLDSGQRSVAPHYHFFEHEWLYIISGSATLLHIDASLPLAVSAPPDAKGKYPFQRVSEGHTSLQEERITLEAGDFAGWLAGARASKYAHTLIGGESGCEYLVGSTRAPRDVVSYPKAGVTMYLEGNYGGVFCASDMPNLTPATIVLKLEHASSDIPELHHPVMRKAEIEEGLGFRRHPLDPETELYHARITDRMGWKMSGMAVHYVRLPPNKASSPVHYHLQEHEWVYILKGSAVLVEVDATLPELAFDKSVEGGLKKSSAGRTELKRTETTLEIGDFVGWQGGVMAAKHAHSVHAGGEGCDYLMGGSRTNVDSCVFPLYGKAFVSDDDFGDNESKFVEVPVFSHGRDIS